MAKTDVKVTLGDDETIRNIIIKTIKALRFAQKDREADAFQRDVVSGRKTLRQVVQDYVILI